MIVRFLVGDVCIVLALSVPYMLYLPLLKSVGLTSAL